MNGNKINRALQGTIAVLFVAFAGQVGYQYWFNKPEPVLFTASAFEPRTLAEAKGLAKEVVEAQVTKVEQGDDLVLPAPGEPGNVERIPTEIITLNVKSALKGKPGQQIRLFRTAGKPVSRRDMPNMKEAPPKPKGASNPPSRPTPFLENTINVHDELPYKEGDKIVAFLRDGPSVRVKGQRVATKTQVNPSTRFRVERDNRITPALPHGLGQAFKGKPIQNFKADIQQAADRGPIPGKIPGQLILPALKIKPGMIRPRGIEGGDAPEGMDVEMGEIEVPTEGQAPELQ
ncbi:MAG: hypothetical protein P8X46_12720 [Nitrospirales bacterium]